MPYTVFAILFAYNITRETIEYLWGKSETLSDHFIKMGPFCLLLFISYGVLGQLIEPTAPLEIVAFWSIINAVFYGIIELSLSFIGKNMYSKITILIINLTKMMILYAWLFWTYAWLFPYQWMNNY
jgi:hypothetical protein